MSKRGFKYGKTTCLNLHDVITLIKTLKTRDEGQKFLKAFREHINLIADSQLSKFLQKHYTEESSTLHEFLELPFWEKPSDEAISTRKSVRKKVGRKRGGLPEDPRLVRPDESSLSGYEASSNTTQ